MDSVQGAALLSTLSCVQLVALQLQLLVLRMALPVQFLMCSGLRCGLQLLVLRLDS